MTTGHERISSIKDAQCLITSPSLSISHSLYLSIYLSLTIQSLPWFNDAQRLKINHIKIKKIMAWMTE